MNDDLPTNGLDADLVTDDLLMPTGESWDDIEDETVDSAGVLDDWIVFPVIALGVVIGTVFPVLLSQQLCLPVLSTLVIFPLFVWAVRTGRSRRAVTLTLFWAFCLAVAMLALGIVLSGQAEATVQGVVEYRSQFIRWMADATPVTAAPAQDWLGQVRDLVIFAVASAITAGLGGLFLLAMAINIVSVNAAGLVNEATRPVQTLLFGWPVWSIARLVGSVLIAVALAEPLASGRLQTDALRAWFHARRRLLLYGLIALVVAALLQLLLSPVYRSVLEAGLGLR
ncbi:MAG: hypothetical protein R2844_08445 [Caldilineales bacterium]